jgi:hypothetical protein
LAPEGLHPVDDAIEVVDRDRQVREARLVEHPLGPRLVAGPMELHQLEDERPASQVRGFESDRGFDAEQRGRGAVGHREAPLDGEAEERGVEGDRPVEVGGRLADVVDDSGLVVGIAHDPTSAIVVGRSRTARALTSA